jgi:hypothetical protein
MNAYELDTRFATTPTKPFSVADEVQKWIDGGQFYVVDADEKL